MTREVAKASEILFDLVQGLEPRLRPLADWFHALVTTIDKWHSSEGNQGVKRAKDILNQGWLAILGEETEELSFVKQHNRIPDLVAPLVDRVQSLKKDPRLMSATLSIIRVTDLWKGQVTDETISRSLEVISKSKLPQSAKEHMDAFMAFVPLFLAKYPNHPISRAWNRSLHLGDSETVFYRESKGPNGPLTANAHKDIKSLMEAVDENGISLLVHLYGLCDQICKFADYSFSVNDVKRLANAVRSWDGYQDLKCSETPGKITAIPEKSGKVRLVAQPDYFSQMALKPLHAWLMRVLTSFDADCTLNQGSAIPKICCWQGLGREIYSFDQSSCTDLFPFELQLQLLRNRFDDYFAESVHTVMAERDWRIKLPSGHTKIVRWSVGQPMGMYGSWPLMALTHHFLVQYCYWSSSGYSFPKEKPFNDYVILGDDVVIASKSVADRYLRVVTDLGMKVNKAKSHITGGKTKIPPVSEFAKITVWKQQPLFPIRPNMVLASVKDWRHAVPLIVDLANVNGFHIRKKAIEQVLRKHYTSGRKFLIPLLTIPRELGGVGYRDQVSMRNRFSLIDTRQIHPWLYFLASEIRSGLVLEQRAQKYSEEIFMESTDIYREHPYRRYAEMLSQQSAWKHLLDREKIPSVPEICEHLLTEGVGNLDRFLIPQYSRVSPQAKELDLRRKRTLWEKALNKPHYFPLGADIVDDINIRCFLESIDLEDGSDPEPLSYMESIQYGICMRTMLARRANDAY